MNTTKKMNNMKHTTTGLILLAILLVISAAGISLLAIPNVRADTGSMRVDLLNQIPNPAVAGSTFTIQVQVSNQGSSPIQNAHVGIVNSFPFTDVDVNSIQTIPSLIGHQSGTNAAVLTFNIRVDPNAQLGNQSLKISYNDGSGGPDTVKQVDILLTNQNYAQISAISRSQLDPGSQSDLDFTITNVGRAPLQNLVFIWTEATGTILPVLSDNSRYIGYLAPGTSVNMSYTVMANVNAAPGLYQLNMNLNYQSVDSNTPSVITSKTGIFVGGQTDFDVAFSESSAGQTSLSVANIGNNPAVSVSVSIPAQPNYQTLGTNTAIIGNLDKGDYTLVSFQISARNSTGTGRTFNRTTSTGTPNAGAGQGQNLPRGQFGNFTDSALHVTIEYTDTTGKRVSVDKTVNVQFRGGSTGSFSGSSQTRTSSSFIGSLWFWVLIVVILAVLGYWYSRSRSHAHHAPSPIVKIAKK